jgi:Uma2 family endonuclease
VNLHEAREKIMSTATTTSAVPQSVQQPISVEAYHRMLDSGLLPEDGRFELLNGVVVEKMTKHPPHVIATRKADQAISPRLPAGWHARIQDPILLDDSEPEPDVAIVRGRLEDYAQQHPGPDEAPLVIEVADTSLTKDREKASIYARNGISIYWIVNVPGRSIEVYSDARTLDESPSYVCLEVYSEDESVPVTLDGTEVFRITVSDLLP